MNIIPFVLSESLDEGRQSTGSCHEVDATMSFGYHRRGINTKVDKLKESLVYVILHGLAGLPSGQAVNDSRNAEHFGDGPENAQSVGSVVLKSLIGGGPNASILVPTVALRC